MAPASQPGLALDAATLAAVSGICRRFQVRRLDMVGSATRADFDPARSDVDLLVDFEPEARIGLFAYVAFADAMEVLFGRHVDLLSGKSLRNPVLRRAVEADRRPLYPR